MHNTRVSARYQPGLREKVNRLAPERTIHPPNGTPCSPPLRVSVWGQATCERRCRWTLGPGQTRAHTPRVPAPRLSPVPIPVPQDDAWPEFILKSKTGLAVTACFLSSQPHDVSICPCAVWATLLDRTCAHSLSLPSSSDVRSLFSAPSATLHGRFLEFTTTRVRYY